MTKHTIEIEGLPEGWEPISASTDPDQYASYLGDDGFLYHFAKIKLQKTKPREITLVETDELNPAYNSVVEEKAMVMNSKYI